MTKPSARSVWQNYFFLWQILGQHVKLTGKEKDPHQSSISLLKIQVLKLQESDQEKFLMRPNSSLLIRTNRGVNHMIHSLSNTQQNNKKPSLGKVLASTIQWDRHIITKWMSTREV